MKNGRLQSKDICGDFILIWLFFRYYSNTDDYMWACWYDGFENSVPFNIKIPEKLRIKKMANLINKGLVEGCGCGCRGDYDISEEGIIYLVNKYNLNYTFKEKSKGLLSQIKDIYNK